MIRASRATIRPLAAGAALAGLLLGALILAGEARAAKKPAGLMVHVPLDGSFIDARALGAVRPEAAGKPDFLPGVAGQAALPAADQSLVGTLHVTRLSRLMLRGDTPAQGTIMVWCRITPAPGDSAAITVIRSDDPLALAIGIASGTSVRATFLDRAGASHTISAEPDSLSGGAGTEPRWVHVALGWDSAAGTVVAFVGGLPLAKLEGSRYDMPDLPHQFALGHPRIAIDDFRLYDRLLSPEELAALPGLSGR